MNISPSLHVTRKLNKLGLVDKGLPYFGWNTLINTVPIHIAKAYNISLIFYAEDGEVEYGGTSESEKDYCFSPEYVKRVYLEGNYGELLNKVNDVNPIDLEFFKFPEDTADIKIMHWSYFENWDPYRNFLVAKQHCGLSSNDDSNVGTFTNFAQNDQILYSLHTYLMYLKFGFGRANQDACIEIRRGAMMRDQAVNLVRLYDGAFPFDYLDHYLDYYQLDKAEFFNILDSHCNHNLF